MCGFCGIVLADQTKHLSRALIEQMADTIRHRGPDDAGTFVAGPVGLGHRRLSIVDLASGHQPMGNEDGTITIVFNGEIYNHAELRPALEAQGHQFRTRSDTEAIVHAYEEMGPACAGKLRGMFAFAIWDAKSRRLTLARDHSGIKPLYFARTPAGDLVFGSEIKALFASGLIEPELNLSAMPEFLATGHVSGERTLLRGVEKLMPGHWMTWGAGRTETGRYWALPPAESESPVRGQGSLAEAGEAFWERFVDAVQSQLMSDVPLGAFLSGGIDSSLLVAAVRELGVAEMNSFSVGYAEAGSSELPWARVAADAFGTRHHEVLLDEAGFFELLPPLTFHRDLPLTFSASIPLHKVSQLAARSVKVVLTGEGSDELFAGYGRYPRALMNLRWGQRLDSLMPGPLRRGIAGIAGGLGNGWLGSRLRRSFLAQPGTIAGAYLEAFAELGEAPRAALLGESARAWAWTEPLRFVEPDLVRANPLEALLRLDQATYLEELLMKQDAMSMASSIESRVPFLDHCLVEWAAGLAPALKLHGFTGKALVRQAAAQKLPAKLLAGPKRGFSVPLGEWLRGQHGMQMVEEVMLSGDGTPVLAVRPMRQLWDRHRNGVDSTAQLWRLLAFRVWQTDTLPRLAALARTARQVTAAQ